MRWIILLMGMYIWYDINFALNFVSKIMQYKDMHISLKRPNN